MRGFILPETEGEDATGADDADAPFDGEDEE